MDRFDAMRVFVAVADDTSFASAARRLKLSPSAVTRLVAALEERLGTRLLQRTTRSVALTDAGRRYLERARRILADLAEAEGAAQAERTVPSGRLVVAASNVFGRLHVAPVLRTFLAAHPAVVGELTLSDRNANLVEDGIDVAVRIGALEDSSLVAKLVGETRLVVVAAPEYLAARRAPRTPAELRDHDCAHFTTLGAAPEWKFGRDGAEARVAITPRFVTNAADVAVGHAVSGAGLARVLSYQVADAVRTGALVTVLDDWAPPPRPIHVVYPTTRMLSAKVRGLVHAIETTCDWRFADLRRPARRATRPRK